MGTKSSIEHLNSYLRGELSAAETYRMALDRLGTRTEARTELLANLASHEHRVAELRDAIRAAGGIPGESSGVWGGFARAVEGAAAALGEKAAIAALEQGEDHGLAEYREDLDDLAPPHRALVVDRLRPAQEETHARLSALKHRM